MSAAYHKFVFVCDPHIFTPSDIEAYSYEAGSFSDALLEFEKEITSSSKEKVCFVWHPISDYVFKYILVFEDNTFESPVTVEVYKQ